MKPLPPEQMKSKLDLLYRRYNRRSYVDPDPLLFLYDYPQARDREIAGLLASSLAYGRVGMIMAAVGDVLKKMGAGLFEFVCDTDARSLRLAFKGFRYRFAEESHLVALMLGIQGILKSCGSVEACFLAGNGERDVFEGLASIRRAANAFGQTGHLLADPEKTSACKRSHLYLRWMVRRDAVDPGGWRRVSKARLVIPVDTHMYRIGHLLGFTRRKSADRRCAVEITEGFRRLVPEDPVRYDFALTRFGIRQQFTLDDLQTFLHSDRSIP